MPTDATAHPMSFLTEALEQQRAHGPDCGVVKTTNAHPDVAKDILELIEGTRDKRVSYSNAAAVLKGHGIHLNPDTISRHVRGQCGCAK